MCRSVIAESQVLINRMSAAPKVQIHEDADDDAPLSFVEARKAMLEEADSQADYVHIVGGLLDECICINDSRQVLKPDP